MNKLSGNGRLAQLVAHPLDVREVTSSSLVSSTIESASKDADSFYFLAILASFLPKKLSRFFGEAEFYLFLAFRA